MYVPVEIIGKKKDFVGRNFLTGKIVFIRKDDSMKIGHYAVVKIHKEFERYDIGTPVLYGIYDKLYGELKDLLMKMLKDIYANGFYFTPISSYEGRKTKVHGLGILYETHVCGDKFERYIDAVSFAENAEKIKEILGYNEKIRAINEKLKTTLEDLDKNPSTALLPDDWDFQKAEWKESGKTKIQRREKVLYSIIQQAPTKTCTEIELRGWTVVQRGIGIGYISNRSTYIFHSEIEIQKPHKNFSKYLTNISDVLQKYGMKVEGGYIIKRFPIPIYSRAWDDSYGAPITGGIYGGCWSGEDYWYFRETVAFNKKAYQVYPAIVAESEEEAMKRAVEIADGDGDVEDISVEQVSEKIWIIKWSVFD